MDEEDNTVDFNDIRNRSFNAALFHSQGNGIALEAGFVLSEPFLRDSERLELNDTLLLTYGRANLNANNIRDQIRRGIHAFFIDDMKLARN